MPLEALANELLLEVFEYIEAAALFQAFYGLNSRFNTLLLIYAREYRLNLQSAFKHRSNIHFQQYLSSIIDRIISLRVSYNNDGSPQQTDFFISSGIELHQFIHLQSLSLSYIYDEEMLHKIMINCQSLPNLTYLKVVHCDHEYMSSIDFFNIIWSLPKLTHCRLDIQSYVSVPTVVSSSIEYLSLSLEFRWLRDLIALFKQTPYLQRLHMPFYNLSSYYKEVLPSMESITMLKLSIVRSSQMMASILKAVPNLTDLKVDTYNIDYDGYDWERIIDDHLPKLKVFRLRMHIQLRDEKKNQDYVDKLVNSFHTRFWLEKHQWFIHCHGTLRYDYTCIIIHTVPYTFDGFDLTIVTMALELDCLEDIHYRLFDRADPTGYESVFCKDWSFAQFLNIRNLSIEFPSDKQFWESMPTLYHLNSLTVLRAEESASIHLQSLLDRAPNLYSLIIKSWPYPQIPLIENTHASLRRLDLKGCRKWPDCSFFSRGECNTFIRSPLGVQCEELLIRIRKGETILDLVSTMRNLRMLEIESIFDATFFIDYELYEKDKDEIIRWLQNQLPLTYAISNFTRLGNAIIVLIRSKEQ